MREALQAVPWVRDVKLDQSTAEVIVLSAEYDPKAIIEALTKASFGGEIIG